MASVIRCAKCPTHIDVSGFPPGTIVQCPACNTQVRIPGAAPQQPAPAAGARRGPTSRRLGSQGGGSPIRSTRMRTPPGNRSATPLLVGIGVLAAAAIGAIVFFAGGESKDEDASPRSVRKTEKPKPAEAEKTPPPPEKKELPPLLPEIRKAPEVKAAPPPPKPEEAAPPEPEQEPQAPKPEKIMVVVDGKEVETFKEWAPGAVAMMKKEHYPPEGVDEALEERARELLKGGKIDDLLAKAYDYYLPILKVMLEDDEEIARSSFEFFDKFCVLYKAKNPETSELHRVDMRLVTSPANRGTVYLMFLAFKDLFKDNFDRHRKFNDPWANPKQYNPAEFNWANLIRDLKHYQAAENPDRDGPYVYQTDPQGLNAINRLKQMGEFVEECYPYLVHFIASPDPGHRKAAVVALNVLTGLNKWALPRSEEDGRRMQKEWMDKLGISELPPGLP